MLSLCTAAVPQWLRLKVTQKTWVQFTLLPTSKTVNNRFESICLANQFESIQQSESNQIPSSSICLAICKAGASSACLLVTRLVLIVLYYELKQFTNILIVHILLYDYLTFQFRVNSNKKVLINRKIIHFALSQFVNAILND